ncbi:15441_t:CDS:2, partial [Acaulospora colombiana]
KEDLFSLKSEDTFDNDLNAIIKAYRDEETARLTSFEVEKRNEDLRISRRWLSKFHELTQERGIWSLGRQTDIHWKLDRRENYSRMRRKLTINYDYDAHRDASAKRDKTPIANSTSKSKNINIQRIKKAAIPESGRSTTPILNAVEPWTDSWGFTGSSLISESESLESDDQEWNIVDNGEVVDTVDLSSNSNLFTVECEMIVLLSVIKGRLELTSTHLSFLVDRRNLLQELNNIEQGSLIVDSEMLRDKKWTISEIREIHMRKYLLRRSAFELFLTDQTNYFFNFPEPKDRLRLFNKITSLKPPSMLNQDTRSPITIFQRSNLTERWQRHEISNFEYLMHLNSMAGRSFNDLTQYFVFPWIISDYKSETLDLSDPKIYRDLSKPIGALNPVRLEQFIDRYESFDDPSGRIKKFALWNSLFERSDCCMLSDTDGAIHFDTWQACLNASGDVRELIPEFFYLPEFLTNHNGFDLGVRQDGVRVSNVGLPKWASTPEEFIRIHREALESDYQTGEEAVKAHNVFYYLTYEGAINIDNIQDPVERKSMEQQIYHFGQTPTQLMTKPHPQRFPSKNFLKKDLLNSNGMHQRFVVELKCGKLQFSDLPNPDSVEKFSTVDTQRIITVDENGIIVITPRCFACSKDGKVVMSAGHWDNTFKVSNTETSRTVASISGHDDIVTAVAISEDGRIVVSGSRCSNLLSWKVNLTHDNEFLEVEPVPMQAYYGHDDEINCIVVNAEHDILISGSKDRTCIVHSLRNANYIRTLRPIADDESSIEFVCITKDANIVIYTELNDQYFLHTYSINGRLLNFARINEKLNHMISSNKKDLIVTSSDRGRIGVYDALSLNLLHDYEIPLI